MKSDKNNKDYSSRKGFEKLKLNSILERRMEDDLMENFQKIKVISYCRYFCQYFLSNLKFAVKTDFKN